MSAPRKGGSRPATGRPRKVAGRRPEQPDPTPEATEPDAAEPEATEPEATEPEATEPEATEPDAPAPTTAPRSRRTTWVLVAVVVLLALVAAAEAVYLARDPHPTVSAKRPVVTGEVTHRTAVEAAARDTEQILSTTYQDYDAQVDQATTLMTDSFADEYRDTASGLADKYAEQQLKLTVEAVSQAVVQASPQQVQALLFLNQYVEKVEDGKPATSVAQYRALVTVVRTDGGWLVSDIETK